MANLITYGVPIVLVLAGNILGGYSPIGSFFGSLIGLVLAVLFMIYRLRAELLMVAGSRALRKKEVQKCFDYYEKAYKTGNLKAEYQLYYAYTAMRYGRMEKAKKLLDMVMKDKTAPENIRLEAKSSYALYLWRTGEIDEAVSCAREVFDKGESTQSYVRLGFLLLEQKSYDEAREINEKAYEFNPDDASVIDNLALSHYYAGEYDKMLELYEQLMEHDPKMPVIYYNYALALEKAGRITEAVDALDDALRCNFSHLAAVSKEQVEKKLDELTQK